MPCLLMFTPSEPEASAISQVVQMAGWAWRTADLSGVASDALQGIQAALFDAQHKDAGLEPLVQQTAAAAPFLPIIFVSETGYAARELGSGLRYHVHPKHLGDLEHILISLSFGFPDESIALPTETTVRRVPRLLIVDDNLELASLIGRSFRALERYDVQVLSSGFEALSVLPAFSPDVAVIDLVLNDMDGRELCSFIRNHERLKNTKIIGVSGYVSADRADAKHEYFDAFLEKPFRMKDILDKVTAFLAVP